MTWLTDLLNWDAGRVLNAAISSAVVIMMSMGLTLHWKEFPPKVRHIGPWVVGTYVIIAYGSATLAAEPGEIPAGYRVGFMMFDLIGLLIVLVWHFDEGYTTNPPSSSTMSQGPDSD